MNKRLGRFELYEQIDAGGYTTVYRGVEDLGEGVTRRVAVKVLQSWKLDDEEQLLRLRHEVSVLVDIGDAPNIVSVYGMGVDPEMGPWIAMELAGKSLGHALADGPAEPDAVRGLLRDILQALRWIHSTDPPIFHRDLKPQNILISGPGVWKLADFGLAKRAGAEETMTLATVKYAAPELLDSTLGEESPRVDIYALGIVVYELALGRELFRKQFPSVYDPSTRSGDGDTDDRPKWMYWHTSMQMVLPPLTDVIEGYPQDLSDLIGA
ncbi:MAG: serine/threonine-protein kinase, partial [Planctomycetota bacterium]